MLLAMSTGTVSPSTASRVRGFSCKARDAARTCRAAHSRVGTAETAEPLLVIVECDGVLCDVHLDGHREAFNETFVALGMEGNAWSTDEYLSLLRSGGGTAYGMLERYLSLIHI